MLQTPDPSPQEIEAACAEIQESWSEQERVKRCAWTLAEVETAVVAVAECGTG